MPLNQGNPYYRGNRPTNRPPSAQDAHSDINAPYKNTINGQYPAMPVGSLQPALRDSMGFLLNPQPTLLGPGDIAPLPSLDIGSAFIEIGASGLQRYGGLIYEEMVPELSLLRWRRTLRAMIDNDPVINASLLAIETLLRQVSFDIRPGGTSNEDLRAAQFLRENLFMDMSSSWQDTLSEIIQFIAWGWSYFELVFKMRFGDHRDPSKRSMFDDGMIGLRKLAPRAQETLRRWEFDSDGGIQAMVQVAPPTFQTSIIPIQKSLLFRSTSRKNNPEGRALDPQTQIPTPEGWRTMDNLQIGDPVYDETGEIYHVVAKAAWERRSCYKLTFSDGTSIIADTNHEWQIESHGRITTRAMANLQPSYQKPLYIKAAKPVKHIGPENSIDPYVAGAMFKVMPTDFNLKVLSDDREELAHHLSVAGARAWVSSTLVELYPYSPVDPEVLPTNYSIAGRKDLLSGLLDTDAYIRGKGRVIYEGVPQAVQTVCRLLSIEHARLAIDPFLAELEVVPMERTILHLDWNPFRLSRKRKAFIPDEAPRVWFHKIVKIEPVAKRRTICIEVDSPSHMFLAGENYVPTHNSVLRGCWEPWYFRTKIGRIEAVGVERDLAGLPIAWVPSEFMTSTATPTQQSFFNNMKTLVTNLRRDELEGVVMPLAYNENGNKLFDLTLLSSGGRRQWDTSAIIQRYDTRIAMAILADFVLLGTQASGSYALADSKVNVMAKALMTFADEVTSVINRHLVPRLFALNGWRLDNLPQMVHGNVMNVPLTDLAAYITALAGAGYPLFPSEDGALERQLMQIANLPASDGSSSFSTATQDMADADAVEPYTPTPGANEEVYDDAEGN